jgi:anti-anti-sigma regulatory factor
VEENKITIESAIATLEDKNEFRTALIKLTNEGHKEILIDLLRTAVLPSELIGFLIDRKRKLKGKGRSMKIIAINEIIRKQFDSIKISEYFGL